MTPVSTLSRDLSVPLTAKIHQLGSTYEWPLGTFDTLTGDQVTTSFRTRGESDVVDEALDTRVTYNPFTGAGQPRTVNGFTDTGHEFYTRKRTSRLSHPYYISHRSNGNWYRGPLCLGSQGGSFTFPSVAKMSQNDIKFYGSKAINRTLPTQPTANVSQMIGELISDGLPITGPSVLRLYETLRRTIQDPPKRNPLKGKQPTLRDFVTGIGDGSLMLQFGVQPLVRDMADIMFAVSSAAQRIEQWYRDSGRQVRRATKFEDEVSLEVKSFSGPAFLTGLNGYEILRRHPGAITSELTIRKETWFSGAYLYYASVGESVLEKIVQYGREADLILGGKFTYETLWELAPWSWLIDWKVNVGDAISNMTRFSADKLVLRYGYLMRKTSATRTYTAVEPLFYDGTPGPVSRQFSVVQKERYRATPYGFAVDPGTFSSAQWQILASLGMSKGGKVLP